MLDRREPIGKATTEDFGAPGPIVDFQAPLTHTLVSSNVKQKGKFEKLYLEGRPPVNVGLTSGGDFLGGTAIAFTDVLGDQQFTLYATSISQYRSFSGSYINLERRFQYARAGLLADPVLLRPARRASSTTRRSAASSTATWRWPRTTRAAPRCSASTRSTAIAAIELFGGVVNYSRGFEDRSLQRSRTTIRRRSSDVSSSTTARWCRSAWRSCRRRRCSASSARSPAAPMRLSYEFAPKIGGSARRARPSTATPASTSASAARGCSRCAPAASRAGATTPATTTSAATPRCAATTTWSSSARTPFHLNAELRLPLIHAMATPIGILGGVRGTLFANVGGAYFDESGLQEPTRATTPSSGRSPATRRPQHRAGRHPGLRRPRSWSRLPPGRRARQLRHRPADLRARLPHPLRLELAHALQQGLGRHCLRAVGRQLGLPQAEVHGVDRLRLLAIDRRDRGTSGGGSQLRAQDGESLRSRPWSPAPLGALM